jgi:hypothetical protein
VGVKATVEAGTRREDFAPASIPVAQHICDACGTHYTGRPDAHACGEISAEAQEMATTAVLTPTGFARLGHGHPGSKKAVENELDAIMLAIRMFHVKQPDQVLRECAAYTARLSELMVMLHRTEGQDRTYLKLRTQQVDKYLAELERQWKTASRLIEVQRQDLFLSGHAT